MLISLRFFIFILNIQFLEMLIDKMEIREEEDLGLRKILILYMLISLIF